MHLLVRETHGLDESEPPRDLAQSPAPLVFLSFSDADLGAAAAAWHALPEGRPGLRLANLARLRHPMSVDLYLARVVSRARCVLVRLLGGLEYWRYGAEEVSALCRRGGIALALLPGDGAEDAALAGLSTIEAPAWARLDACLRAGGPANLQAALTLAAHLAGLGPDGPAARAVAAWGEIAVSAGGWGGAWAPADTPLAPPPHPDPLPQGERGLAADRLCASGEVVAPPPLEGGGWEGGSAPAETPPVPTPHPGRLAQADKTPAPDARAAILFYRSHALSADTAPIAALADALAARGMQVRAFFLDSLKNPQTAAAIAATLRAWRPSVVLNATGFAAPLDAAGAPVLQLVLAGSTRDAWAAATRGLSPADLAMQVVLPEFDGRLATTAISFKEEAAPDPTLEYAARRHRPDPDGIALAADRAAGWARLSGTRRAARRIGVMLSDYPGGQAGHAVGLDSFASLAAILALLADEGFATTPAAPAELAAALTRTPPRPLLSLDRYRSLFTTLPQPVQDAVTAAWGDPADDPAIADGCFTLRQLHLGRIWIALQPDRGSRLDRRAGYHDPDTPPRHGFVAAHLWLRHVYAAHALVQLGAHGTLEWLPGKPVAPAAACLPSALAGGLPVIYPFIANNPGEAAPAKRRLGAVTIGHLTPPLRPAGSHGAALELERLIDDHAGADGLDRRRTAILRREILDRAAATGLLAESGVAPDAPEDAALARLDAYLCDVKDMLIGDGLHVFATAPEPARRALLLAALQRSCPGFDPATLDACAGAERAGLLAALDGRFVPAGPAGAPTRGRADVLPTGRNLSAIDPRAVPTRAALTLAERAADELLRRHLQDHGDWPRHLVLELWGSATMRTGGEAFALALVLLGARPVWDAGSARVSGVEILPLAVLDRPRVDVTLRISGLFRDAFEAQLALFDTAIGAIAARDEAAEWNPLAAACRGLDADARRRATARIYGPAGYGAGIAERLARGAWGTAAELGQAYLDASAQAFGRDGEDAAGLAARIRDAAAFVHVQDHREADLLDGTEHAAHQGGFAAAATALGAAPALYHADMSDPDAPRARTLQEEIARVVRGRAANPGWIAGMTRHGASGAAEIARAVEGLAGFAATVPFRLDRQFDLLFAATLAAPEVDDFLRAASPAAHQAIAARFAEALRRDLWRPHRNDAAARLGVAA